MKICVHLYGTLRRFSLPHTPGLWVGELHQNANIRDLMERIGTTQREVAVASINGQASAFDTPIPENAKIILVTNMGGG